MLLCRWGNFGKNIIFATNSAFLILLSLQPNVDIFKSKIMILNLLFGFRSYSKDCGSTPPLLHSGLEPVWFCSCYCFNNWNSYGGRTSIFYYLFKVPNFSVFKELSLCLKLWFSKLYIFATQCSRPKIFKTLNSAVR